MKENQGSLKSTNTWKSSRISNTKPIPKPLEVLVNERFMSGWFLSKSKVQLLYITKIEDAGILFYYSVALALTFLFHRFPPT